MERYLKNPVLCLNHNHNELPIGTVSDLRIVNNQLVGNINIYESDEDSEHAKLCRTISDMVDKGIIKGISISTRDIETYPNQYGGDDIIQSELLEISLVTLPNNENSLVL